MRYNAGYVGPIALGLVTDGFGAEAALAAGASLLVVAGGLFAWLAPESYRAGY